MSERWPGGIVRSTPVTPTGPFQNGAASGVWSLADAAYWTKQGLWPLAGNTPPAIEDYFSTYLYTGNGSTQTITNGIDLAGKGGLVWVKKRNASESHFLVNSASPGFRLETDTTGAQGSQSVLSLASSGFSLLLGNAAVNGSGSTYASWTFREAPKFFDVVTYTGNGANRNIAHNLGVAPGMMIVKRTDSAANWQVYHRSNANTEYMVLNSTAAKATGTTRWNSTTPTATEFTVGTDAAVNASGATYVAYLYAHDATSDGVIQCGSYTETGSAVTVNLGWEPQWLMVKRTDSTGNWVITDNMRTLNMSTTNGAVLFPNTSGAETNDPYWHPTATGFVADPYWGSGASVVYMAIRRGPMRTPTLGTSVFAPIAGTGSASTIVTTGFSVDLLMARDRAASNSTFVLDRLRGISSTSSTSATWMKTDLTDAENTSAGFPTFFNNTGFTRGSNFGTANMAFWSFRRAPGFMDEVCYTGSGSGTQTPNHNLTVTPEMFIVKARGSAGYDWMVWHKDFGLTGWLTLNQNSAKGSFSAAWPSLPTATVFPTSSPMSTDNGGTTYVAYLFASCPGVSKVGSYTGNGSSQTINCAFTTGSRFVMIKRTDSTGDWYVWDSARGIVAGNDPYLALNTTAAEVTTNDSVDTDNTGFIVNQVAASNVNVNGATYIFLAIA